MSFAAGCERIRRDRYVHVAGVRILLCLLDILGENDFGLKASPQALGLECLLSGAAIRRQFRVRNGDALDGRIREIVEPAGT